MTALNIALASVGYILVLLVVSVVVALVLVLGQKKFGDVGGAVLGAIAFLIIIFGVVYGALKMLGFS